MKQYYVKVRGVKTMRKRFGIFLALSLSAFLCACTTPKEAAEEKELEEQQETIEETTEETVADEVTEADEEGPIVSYLTGYETTAEERDERPLAVMLNNIEAGCPQYGSSAASIIYEAPVEGRITRLMGIFENYEDLEKIGSVRSSRDYYLFFADEYDCIYAHFGQATLYVGDLLNSEDTDNISGAVSGIDKPATNTFIRTTDRKAPHNVFITIPGLLTDIEKFGYRTTLKEDYQSKFVFMEDGDDYYSSADEATIIYPGGKESNKANGFSRVQARFEYNPEDGKYYRFQYGDIHIDEMTGEQLCFDNVILQYCVGSVRDEHDYLAFGCHGNENRKVQIFTQGKMIEGYWNRADDSVPAIYTDAEGNVIPVSKGKTWICIIWDDYADDVVIE